MSWQRAENVADHAPATIKGTSRLLLIAIAMKTSGKDPRIPHVVEMARADLARRVACDESNIRQIVEALTRAGYDVRVPMGKDKEGRPVYATRGHLPRWCVPYFPPPDGCCCEACWHSTSSEKGESANAPSKKEGESMNAPNEKKGRSPIQEGEFTNAPLPTTEKPSNQSGAAATPPAPPTPASKRGEGEELRQKADKILTKAGHQLSPADRNRVHTATIASLTAGHPEAAILEALSKPIDGLNQIGAGLAARLTTLGAPPSLPAPGSMTREQARQQPPCHHGRAGGWCINANGGQPWCPQCRRDVVAGVSIGPGETERSEQPEAPSVAEVEHGGDFKRLINSAAASLSAGREPSRAGRRFPPGQGVCVDCAEVGELCEATAPDGSYCSAHERARALR